MRGTARASPVNLLPHRLATACLLLALCAHGAAASPPAPPGPPPMRLHATPGANGTALLAWQPPLAGPAPTAYRVYADGRPVALVFGTSHAVLVGRPALYSVTAEGAGGESAPASLVVGELRVQPDWPFRTFGPVHSNCPPVGLNVYTHSPFVAYAIYEECLPILPP
jgi:hypothetical protein